MAAMPSAANQASFRKLLMVAFCIAMMGLFGNLVHLHSLTTKFKNDPSDLITHYIMSDEHDEANAAESKQKVVLPSNQEQRQRRATLEEDSTNNNSNNNNAKEIQQEQPTKQQQQPTISLLRRLLRESIDSLEACRRARTASLAGARGDAAQHHHNNNNVGGSGRRRLLEDTPAIVHRRHLARFGWLNTLTNYLATSSVDAEPAIQQQQHEECSIPSSQPACHVQNMSMLVLSQGTDLRRLFVNLLSWLLYSSVGEITVLLPTSEWSTLADNVKYGRRLQDWHNDPNHKVRLLPYNHSLWDGIRSYHRQPPSTGTTTQQQKQHSDAIVFMNGDVRWRGNEDGLQSGLALWQRHPASVVASSASLTVLRVHASGPNRPPVAAAGSESESSSEGRSLPFCKHETLQHDNATTVIASSSSRRRLEDNGEGGDSETSFQERDPTEGDETESVTEKDDASDGDVTEATKDATETTTEKGDPKDQEDASPSLSILDISGLIIHRNYLCLLAHHHVVKPLTHFASSFHEAQVAMSILLTLASSRSSTEVGLATLPLVPRLYPVRMVRPNATTLTTKMDVPSSSNIGDGVLVKEGNSALDRSRRRLRSSSRSRRRLLVEDDPDGQNEIITISLDDETITNIMGYFGSLPPKPKPWCTPSEGSDRSGGTTTCPSLPDGEVSPSDLDWLRPGTSEHDLCPSV